eukprot:CAMPEP_0174699392 /NCGR_PEP_ID=MMETSP1094-20130205/4684_1 /TAXON_ID=156173 /ORGANISM="Chrysochromulina brevifilum, Strain UTEX LB 985" /LENGTH=85 /DNA_ID=CAMNT_0015896709 /DNA_START=114 /DNA_END=371 /DNA_ORIENTATION=+
MCHVLMRRARRLSDLMAARLRKLPALTAYRVQVSCLQGTGVMPTHRRALTTARACPQCPSWPRASRDLSALDPPHMSLTLLVDLT